MRLPSRKQRAARTMKPPPLLTWQVPTYERVVYPTSVFEFLAVPEDIKARYLTCPPGETVEDKLLAMLDRKPTPELYSKMLMENPTASVITQTGVSHALTYLGIAELKVKEYLPVVKRTGEYLIKQTSVINAFKKEKEPVDDNLRAVYQAIEDLKAKLRVKQAEAKLLEY
eukprot:scaffold1666_cov122-Amphora_coffeaeformis.AAC.1